jgi:hypothetical protein
MDCGSEALDQLHREEVNPVGFLYRVERDDVRVIERGDGASLALEACQAARDRGPSPGAAP